MTQQLDELALMDYPGRFIAIGKNSDGNANVVIYGLTGRSPSSRTRKLVLDDTTPRIKVVPTNEAAVRAGNPELLIYDAVAFFGNYLAVSNGKQTESIAGYLQSNLLEKPISVLTKSLDSWTYEPDSPTFTPRISGCALDATAALSIIKRHSDGSSIKNYFEFALLPGAGKLISTYKGPNASPLPSFSGEPADVQFDFKNAKQAVDAVFNSVCSEYFVAASAVFLYPKKLERQIAIRNI